MTRSSLDDFQKVRGRERMNYSPWKKKIKFKTDAKISSQAVSQFWV